MPSASDIAPHAEATVFECLQLQGHQLNVLLPLVSLPLLRVCVCAFVRPPLPLCPVSELVWMTYAEGQRRPHGPFPWAGSSPGRHSLTHSVKCNQPNVPPNDHDTLSNATMPNGIWLKTGHDWLGGILA